MFFKKVQQVTHIVIFNTENLSFLDRERDRTVNVPWPFSTIRSKALLRSDSNVSRRSWPFTFPDRSLFLTIPDRFMSVFDRFMTFFCIYGLFYRSYLLFEYR
jgi:hypothetical protein